MTKAQIHSHLLMCACGLALGLHAYASQDDVIINNQTFGSGTTNATWANYTIESTGTVTIQSGADVRWTAGETIILGPGFKAENGSYFKALISSSPVFDPGGYYTANPPLLVPISNTTLYGLINTFNAQPFDIAIWNETGTAPLVGAQVLILLESGAGGLATNTAASAPFPNTLTLTTDQDGTIRFYYFQPATVGVQARIRIIAGTRSYSFATQSYTTTPGTTDQDSDGLSDTTETLLGTDPSNASTTTTQQELALVIHL